MSHDDRFNLAAVVLLQFFQMALLIDLQISKNAEPKRINSDGVEVEFLGDDLICDESISLSRTM